MENVREKMQSYGMYTSKILEPETGRSCDPAEANRLKQDIQLYSSIPIAVYEGVNFIFLCKKKYPRVWLDESAFDEKQKDEQFLSEIKSSEPNNTIMNSMVVFAALSHVQINVLLNLVHHNDRFIRLTVVTWIYEFVLVTEWSIPYARLFRVLLPCYADSEKEVQEKAQATCWELLKSVGISLLYAL